MEQTHTGDGEQPSIYFEPGTYLVSSAGLPLLFDGHWCKTNECIKVPRFENCTFEKPNGNTGGEREAA